LKIITKIDLLLLFCASNIVWMTEYFFYQLTLYSFIIPMFTLMFSYHVWINLHGIAYFFKKHKLIEEIRE
jgi:hypothetical protein